MKTYEQLRPEEQEDAYQDRMSAMLDAIVGGTLTFEGFLAERLVPILDRIERDWWLDPREVLMGDIYVQDAIEALALAEAQVAFYSGPGDKVIGGIAQ